MSFSSFHRNSKLQKQVRSLQEGESSYYRQVRALKEELSQKGVMLVRTNEGQGQGQGQQRGRIRFASGSLIDQVSKSYHRILCLMTGMPHVGLENNFGVKKKLFNHQERY